VPWFEVTFMVEAESAEEFDAAFDEDKIAKAMPGRAVYLAVVVEKPDSR
jgi:hypothetical protein